VVLLAGCAQGAGGSPVNRTAAQEAAAEATKHAAEAEAAAAAALAPEAVTSIEAATGHCRSIAAAAERTMTARQMGAPMSDVMEAATKAGGVYEKIVVDAYDWLARTHAAVGELQKSQAVLSDAVAVSPHAVRRLRTLADTAFEVGDVDTAEKALRQVVGKAKYSEFRDPEDHVKLVRALVHKGDPVGAAAVVRDLDRSMGGRANTPLCSAIASALVHEYTGNEQRLGEALGTALASSKDAPNLSADLKLELARTCIDNGREEGASEIVREVMSNAPNDAMVTRAMGVLEQAGKGELAQTLAQQSRQQVVDLVAGGAARAKNGDYDGAVRLMLEAATKLPSNPAVAFNAALAVLRCLEHEGWDNRLGAQVPGLIGNVRKLDPLNPKLPALAALHHQVLKQYNQGMRQGAHAAAPLRKAG